MIKKITLITVWIFAVATFKIAAQDVSVTVKMPANSSPDSTFKVELTVNKGDVAGFAKLEQLLPAGLEATAAESANSTFSFKERKVKFLWMSLPAETSFKVTYNVKVAPGTSGNQIFEGTFAYILNNETQKITLGKEIIFIGAPLAVASNEVKTNVVETPHNNAEADKAAADAAAKAAADAAAAKAKADADAAAKANQQNQAATKAAEDKAAKDAAAAQKKADLAAANASKQTTKVQTEAVAVKEGKPVDGLVFRAQVAAGKKKVSPSVFQAEYKISDEIFWEDHDGWNKYTAGNFTSYRAAKTYANQLRDSNGVNGSFVVAYNKGTRISVQEALNLSNGK